MRKKFEICKCVPAGDIVDLLDHGGGSNMDFFFGKQDLRTLDRAQEHGVLLTNGLGGYASVTTAFSVNRCDQGLLVAAVQAPNVRINMVHRLRETLEIGGKKVLLSTQSFADGTAPEEGYRNLSCFSYSYLPQWVYETAGVRVVRRCAAAREENTVAVLYTVENHTDVTCTLRVDPFLKFAPKE